VHVVCTIRASVRCARTGSANKQCNIVYLGIEGGEQSSTVGNGLRAIGLTAKAAARNECKASVRLWTSMALYGIDGTRRRARRYKR